MPYKSAKQRAYMHIHHPDIAKRWDKKYGGKISEMEKKEEMKSMDHPQIAGYLDQISKDAPVQEAYDPEVEKLERRANDIIRKTADKDTRKLIADLLEKLKDLDALNYEIGMGDDL